MTSITSAAPPPAAAPATVTVPAAPTISAPLSAPTPSHRLKRLHWEPHHTTNAGSYWAGLKVDDVHADDEAVLREAFGTMSTPGGVTPTPSPIPGGASGVTSPVPSKHEKDARISPRPANSNNNSNNNLTITYTDPKDSTTTTTHSQQPHHKPHLSKDIKQRQPSVKQKTLLEARENLKHVDVRDNPGLQRIVPPVQQQEDENENRSASPHSHTSLEHLVISTSIASPPSSAVDSLKRTSTPSLSSSTSSMTTTSAQQQQKQQQQQQRGSFSARSSRTSLSSSSNSLQIPDAGNAVYSLPQVDMSKSSGMTLGDLFKTSKKLSESEPSSPRSTGGMMEESNSRRSLLNSHLNSQQQSSPQPKRSLTPQPQRRGGKQRGADIEIDADLMPNFVFLSENKPLLAARLPPPSPSTSPTRGGGSGPGTRSITPRNLEIGALHAYAEPDSNKSSDDHYKKPRVWHFTNPTESGSRNRQHHAKLHVSLNSAPSSNSMNASVTPTTIVSSNMFPSASSSSSSLPTSIESQHARSTSAVFSPTTLFSPIALGSGILNDIISTQDRVMNSIREGTGVVMVDEQRIIEHLSKYHTCYEEITQYNEDEYHGQLLVRRYNSDRPGLVSDHIPHTPDVEIVQRILGTKDGGVIANAAIPYAPSEWYFNPANLPLVLMYHLVLTTIDYGLAEVPGKVMQKIVGFDKKSMRPIIKHYTIPYTSLDLATNLSEVIRVNAHAFDPEALTKMDELRLGSWLQPEVFAKHLKENPELDHSSTAAAAAAAGGATISPPTSSPDSASSNGSSSSPSTSSSLPTIPFTFPNLKERARLLRELGFVMLRFFNGSICKLLDAADHSASRLIEILTQHLTGMRDMNVYHGSLVYFYSRAQLYVKRIWIAFHGHSYGYFHDLDEVHGQTDSVIQTIFHHLGFINYSNELKAWIKDGVDMVLLSNEIEIEMRCATGYIMRRMTEILRNFQPTQHLMEIQLDCWLRRHLILQGQGQEHHALESFIPDKDGHTRKVVPLIQPHRSTGMWY